MGKINYQAIYDKNRHDWYEMTNNPQKYEALLAGHYSESNHFIYELLQNAEDERADTVVFEYYQDQLVFYHNGKPFDEADVRSIASMLMGTKDKNDAQTIGRFGMGFKSVFKYTCQPEIYSNETAFRIKNYLLPEEIENGWDYKNVKKELKYPSSTDEYFYPFSETNNLTKFVIPFIKRDDKSKIVSISGKDVLQKLIDLPVEILLFLTFIKKLYWIDKTSGNFEMITFETDEADRRLVTCQRIGSGKGNNEKAVRYLKFTKKFNHPEMKGAEVSVAYKANNRATNINEIQGSDTWVYFPTRDHNQLPFMIHGSFETAVSREKLMTPSEFNDDLFDKLGDLICDSMLDLRDRHLITQTFIRKILLEAFKDEDDNNTIPGLKCKISRLFTREALLPDTEGNYYEPHSLKIAVPFDLADFVKNTKLVAFNQERDANFTEYYNWLVKDLHMELYTLEEWALNIKYQNVESLKLDKKEINKMGKVYDFLLKYKESFYLFRRQYNRNSSSYEYAIRSFIEDAWEALRQAPIVVNAENKFVSAYKGETPGIYLSSSSDYKSILRSSIVHPTIANNYQTLLKEDFQIKDFDNFQYVTEKVIKKYINVNGFINFEHPSEFENEYVEDLEQIIDLFKTEKDADSIREFLKQAYIIKISSDEDKSLFAKPQQVYVPISDEGIDLQIYYEPIAFKVYDEEDDEEYEEEYFQPEYDLIDINFFEKHAISLNNLRQFGLITSPVNDGDRSNPGGHGVESWKALGEYCPEMEVEGLEETLQFIEDYPEMEQAKRKSKEIFKLVCAISKKLSGTEQRRKSDPYVVERENNISKDIKRYYNWLYDKNEEVHAISGMSKYDLNPDIYGPLLKDKSVYESLGFRKDENDKAEKVFEEVGNLNPRDQKIIFNQLARKLGINFKQNEKMDEDIEEEDPEFRAEEWMSSEFPLSPIKNINSLKQHVEQQFYCADPVKYESVLQQVRTSTHQEMNREYVAGMYTNYGNQIICQMCKQKIDNIETTEIANYGIELPQLHLCLCNNCARKYKTLKSTHKKEFSTVIKKEIQKIDISDNEDVYEIGLRKDIHISFTPTHVAELQAIFELLDNYGKPSNLNSEDKTISDKADRSSNASEITDIGAKVTHKKYGDGIVVDVEQGRLIYVEFENGVQKGFGWKQALEDHCISLRQK